MPSPPDSTTPDPLALALGVRVRTERERLGMTKEALGDAAGLASRYVWRVEDGRQNITFANLAKLASALGLTMSELLREVEAIAADPPPRPQKRPRGRAGQAGGRSDVP